MWGVIWIKGHLRGSMESSCRRSCLNYVIYVHYNTNWFRRQISNWRSFITKWNLLHLVKLLCKVRSQKSPNRLLPRLYIVLQKLVARPDSWGQNLYSLLKNEKSSWCLNVVSSLYSCAFGTERYTSHYQRRNIKPNLAVKLSHMKDGNGSTKIVGVTHTFLIPIIAHSMKHLILHDWPRTKE